MSTYPLKWDQIGEKVYETGTDRGVVYPYDSVNKQYGNGAAWNGLTGFTDSPSGADETALWADNIKYVSIRAAEEYGGTITAYTYPDEFAECDGSAIPVTGITIGGQKRKSFGFSCRTLVGNDTELNDFGYKIHLVWGASVSPSDKDYATVNDSPDAIEFSWEFTTTPVDVGTAYKKTAHMTIDTSKMTLVDGQGADTEAGTALKKLEAILYGSSEASYWVTTSAPADWATSYTSYYTKSGDTYTAVPAGSGAPEWEANTYYEKVEPTPARLPSPGEVITLFGGSPNVTQG